MRMRMYIWRPPLMGQGDPNLGNIRIFSFIVKEVHQHVRDAERDSKLNVRTRAHCQQTVMNSKVLQSRGIPHVGVSRQQFQEQFRSNRSLPSLKHEWRSTAEVYPSSGIGFFILGQRGHPQHRKAVTTAWALLCGPSSNTKSTLHRSREVRGQLACSNAASCSNIASEEGYMCFEPTKHACPALRMEKIEAEMELYAISDSDHWLHVEQLEVL